MKADKKTIILSIVAVAVVIATLLLLLPIEKKRAFNKKWGALAELAQTDSRAKFITENEELYPSEILQFFYTDNSTLDYVYNYHFHKDDYNSMTYTEEELNCNGMPALYMEDTRWCYQPMGERTIKSNGCAAVCLTMAYLYLRDDSDIDPYKIAVIAQNMDAIGLMDGIISSAIPDVAKEIGLSAVEYRYFENNEKTADVEFDEIKSIIDSGNVVFAGFIGETFGNHAVIIRDYDENGNIYINDPAKPENTAKTWPFDELKSEIYYIWNLGYEK